jgi:flagellar hook-associated protein 1 FlgK
VEDAARTLALDADLVASTDAIAAGQTADPGDNRNALDLAALRTAASAIYLPGDPPGPASGPTQTLLDYTGTVVNRVGQQTRSLEEASVQRARVLEELETRRQEVSGVSLDEEVVMLVQLQATFQANARVIATVQGLLDDVLSLL